MEILKQALLDFLKRKSNIDLKDIKRELKIQEKDETILLEKCLRQLEIESEVYKDNKNRYSLLRTKPSIMQGKVHFLSNGNVSVVTNDNSSITILKENADGLLDKDIITVKNLQFDRKNNLYGILDKIVKRNLF